MTERAHIPIRVVQARDGSITYLINRSPDELPPVRSGDLADAWAAAREAASESEWGQPRLFRFCHADGSTLDMALADQDACCWAEAVDQTACMRTPYGLSLCLRLLALVDLLARTPWTEPLCRIGRGGAALHPALVRTAATAPLTSGASFDEALFRVRLGGAMSPATALSLTASGALHDAIPPRPAARPSAAAGTELRAAAGRLPGQHRSPPGLP